MSVLKQFTLLSRNFAVDETSIQRLRAGTSLEIEVQLSGMGPEFMVEIHTNILSESGDWQSHPLEQKENGIHKISLYLKRAGAFGYRLKFSGDNGHSWHWDAAPYSKLMVEPSDLHNLRIYTLIPSSSGSFINWSARLGEIRRMGFNVIQLLPLTPMGESQSPYSTVDLFAIDAAYLNQGDTRSPEDQFGEFVKSANEAGLTLCLDLVFNHIGKDAPLVRQNPEWIVPDPDETDGFKRAGWWKGDEWIKWQDILLLNYSHPEDPVRQAIWQTMTDYGRYWVRLGCASGGIIRLDNYHSSHQGFMSHLLKLLRVEFPRTLVLAELFAHEKKIRKYVWERRLDLLLGTEWEEKFVPELRKLLIYIHKKDHPFKFFTPLNSHDSGTPAQEFGTTESIYPRYITAALLGTGFTGVVQGAEWGAPRQINFRGPQRGYTKEGSADYREFISFVNSLLNTHQVFHEKGNIEFVDKNHDAIIAGLRKSVGDPPVLILANFDSHHERSITINIGGILNSRETDIEFKELHTGISGIWHEPSIDFHLPPCGFSIFSINTI